MFRKEAPFKYTSEGVYGNLDDMHIKIMDMEVEMKELADSASLFEVNMPEFKQLKGCRREVKLLKVNFCDLKLSVNLGITNFIQSYKLFRIKGVICPRVKFMENLRE